MSTLADLLCNSTTDSPIPDDFSPSCGSPCFPPSPRRRPAPSASVPLVLQSVGRPLSTRPPPISLTLPLAPLLLTVPLSYPPPASSSAAESAKAAVFVQSEDYQGTKIKGPDFNNPHSLQELLRSYETIGFQANGLARAIELIDKMVRFPVSPLTIDERSSPSRFCIYLFIPSTLPAPSQFTSDLTAVMAPLGRTHQPRLANRRARPGRSRRNKMLHLPRLHLEPRLVRSARDYPLPRSAQVRLVPRHDGGRHRGGLNQVPRTDVPCAPGGVQPGRGWAEAERVEPDRQLACSQRQLLQV